jgi:magnesium transporter
MTRIIRHVTPGASPGALIAPKHKEVERPRLHVVCYGPDGCDEREVETLAEALPLIRHREVTWIDVVGVQDVELLQLLGQHFGLHPLALEDVMNVGQRPKVEEHSDHFFVIMRLLHLGTVLRVEQVSLFFSKNVVITLQEYEGDPFDPIRERIRNAAGRIRNRGADYLAYALVDALEDSLFPVLETYGEWIEEIEEELLRDPAPEMLETIQRIKRDLLWVRRAAWPHREVISSLERSESELISKGTKKYLRDAYEHSVQVMDVVETFRDLAGGLMDLYLSKQSHHMNEVMKVLTIMASIFIPLTFIAGIYGMNFDHESSPLNMPELHWAWGYPVAIGAMVTIGLGMVFYFRRKRWL